jgi:hypothetical protein
LGKAAPLVWVGSVIPARGNVAALQTGITDPSHKKLLRPRPFLIFWLDLKSVWLRLTT